MTPSLELTENALTGHLPLQMFDGSFDALVPNLDFEGSTLDCFARNSQGARHMAETRARRKSSRGPSTRSAETGQQTSLITAAEAPLGFEHFPLGPAPRPALALDGRVPLPHHPRDMPAGSQPRPRLIKAPHGSGEIEITWEDGRSRRIPHEILRGYCPCASCQGHSGSIRFVPGGNLELLGIERVGNYALSLTWGDGHSSGIFSYRYLSQLCDELEARGTSGLMALGELPR